MKVLQLPAYYFPEQAASSYLGDNTRKAMCDSGIIVDLYTPMPTRGISPEIREKYSKIPVEYQNDRKLIIHRFPMFNEGKNPLSRAFRYTMCMFKHFYYGVRAKDIDLIYLASTPPIQGILGGVLKKVKKVPFVYNLQDIFPDSLAGTGLANKGSILWKIGRVIENFTYRNADKIIVISEDFKKNIMAKGVPEEKIEVIYNWVDEKVVKPISKEDNELFDNLNINRETFKVVYAGNLGFAQNVKVLIDAAELCKSIKDLEFIIFGKGGLEKEYKECIRNKSLSNVKFYPLQPVEKVSQVYSMADVSLVSCKKGLGGSAMPSKTWNIMSTGTPVVCSFDKGGDLQHIVEDNELGFFSDADDVQSLVDNILRLYNDRKLCKKMGFNARQFILSNLTREIGSSKYVKVIEEVIKANEK